MSVNAEAVAHEPRAILERMATELRAGPPAAEQRWPALLEQAHAIPRGQPRALVLTGCGDSYYAGLSARGYLERCSGLPVVVWPAMEVVAFPSVLLRPDVLLVGVSVSGKVGRTIEAVSAHTQRGGQTVAVTAHADSDLGTRAEAVLATGLRGTPGPVPGTANYLGSLTALFALGVELAARRGAPGLDNQAVPRALDALAALVAGDGSLPESVAAGITPPFFVLGSGPDFGAASMGVAKFLEASATIGLAQDLEEWAHEQYFATGEGTTVVVHATTAAARERARAAGALAARVAARVVTIAPAPLGIDGELHWRLPITDEDTAPLLAWAPMALTALAYARRTGRAPFGLDREQRMQAVDENIYVPAPARA